MKYDMCRRGILKIEFVVDLVKVFSWWVIGLIISGSIVEMHEMVFTLLRL